jgi:hypothetical protein
LIMANSSCFNMTPQQEPFLAHNSTQHLSDLFRSSLIRNWLRSEIEQPASMDRFLRLAQFISLQSRCSIIQLDCKPKNLLVQGSL